MANQTYPMETADEPIIGLRVALRPIVKRKDGKTRLLKEIAAKVLELPPDCLFVQRIELRTTYLGDDERKALFYGPDFIMVPE